MLPLCERSQSNKRGILLSVNYVSINHSEPRNWNWSLGCQTWISLCLVSTGRFGFYQMGNGLFLRLIKVLPESEVGKNLRQGKAGPTLSPTNRSSPAGCSSSRPVIRSFHYQWACTPVTLLHPLSLVLNTFLMDTILLKVFRSDGTWSGRPMESLWSTQWFETEPWWKSIS